MNGNIACSVWWDEAYISPMREHVVQVTVSFELDKNSPLGINEHTTAEIFGDGLGIL